MLACLFTLVVDAYVGRSLSRAVTGVAVGYAVHSRALIIASMDLHDCDPCYSLLLWQLVM